MRSDPPRPSETTRSPAPRARNPGATTTSYASSSARRRSGRSEERPGLPRRSGSTSPVWWILAAVARTPVGLEVQRQHGRRVCFSGGPQEVHRRRVWLRNDLVSRRQQRVGRAVFRRYDDNDSLVRARTQSLTDMVGDPPIRVPAGQDRTTDLHDRNLPRGHFSPRVRGRVLARRPRLPRAPAGRIQSSAGTRAR